MTTMSGDGVAAEIKETTPAKPIIMVTGFGDVMDAADEKPQNVDYLLSKPFSVETLRHAINAVMET